MVRTRKWKGTCRCIGVGADHWAARREQVSLFAHLWRMRTAYQRCVRVAALYEGADTGRPCRKERALAVRPCLRGKAGVPPRQGLFAGSA